jgi:hypothetical protein
MNELERFQYLWGYSEYSFLTELFIALTIMPSDFNNERAK